MRSSFPNNKAGESARRKLMLPLLTFVASAVIPKGEKHEVWAAPETQFAREAISIFDGSYTVYVWLRV